MKVMKTRILLVLVILGVVLSLFLSGCGAETTKTAEQAEATTSTDISTDASTTVATQSVVTEESVAVEETVVVETDDDTVAVDVSTGASGVSVDVSTEGVSVDEEETEASDESTKTDVEVKIENYFFDEKAITVKAGTTVIWENYDSAPHTVTGDGLDSGKMSKGDTYEFTFTKPGTYKYYCAYHPSMTAKVIVE